MSGDESRRPDESAPAVRGWQRRACRQQRGVAVAMIARGRRCATDPRRRRGTLPGLRLQRALRDPYRLTRLDYVLTGVYHGLWLAPHAVLGWMLLRHPDHVTRIAGRLAGVYHLTTLGYWYLPTAPPWWASEHEGLMGGEIQHVARDVRAAITDKLG